MVWQGYRSWLIIIGLVGVASCTLSGAQDAHGAAQASTGTGEGQHCAGFIFECAEGLDCISNGFSEFGTCERSESRQGLQPLVRLQVHDERLVSTAPSELEPPAPPAEPVPTLRNYIDRVLALYVVPTATSQALKIQELEPLLDDPNFYTSLQPKYARLYENKLQARHAIKVLQGVGGAGGDNVRKCLDTWNNYDFYSSSPQSDLTPELSACLSMYEQLISEYDHLFAQVPIVSTAFLDRLRGAISLARSIVSNPAENHLTLPKEYASNLPEGFQTGTQQLVGIGGRFERATLVAQAPFAVSLIFERLLRELQLVEMLYPIISMQVTVSDGAGGWDTLPLGQWALDAMNDPRPVNDDGYPLATSERFRQAFLTAWAATRQYNRELLDHVQAGWHEDEAWKLWVVAEAAGFVTDYPEYAEIHTQLKSTIEELATDPTPVMWSAACIGAVLAGTISAAIVTSVTGATAGPLAQFGLGAGVSLVCLPASYYSAQWVFHLSQIVSTYATMAYMGIDQGLVPSDAGDPYEKRLSFATAMFGLNVIFLVADVARLARAFDVSLKFMHSTVTGSRIGSIMPHSWKPPGVPLRASGKTNVPAFMLLESTFDRVNDLDGLTRFEALTQLEILAQASLRTASDTPSLSIVALRQYVQETVISSDSASNIVLWLLARTDGEIAQILQGVDAGQLGAIRAAATALSGYAKHIPQRVADALASDVTHLREVQAAADDLVAKLETLITSLDALP